VLLRFTYIQTGVVQEDHCIPPARNGRSEQPAHGKVRCDAGEFSNPRVGGGGLRALGDEHWSLRVVSVLSHLGPVVLDVKHRNGVQIAFNKQSFR